MTPLHIIALIQDKKHDGTYLNGYPEIVQWLLEQQRDCPLRYNYYIECLNGHNSVRVWSSLPAYTLDKEKRSSTNSIPRTEKSEAALTTTELPHPLLLEAREAVRQKDFQRLHDIKAQMRRQHIPYDKREFDLRDLINKSRF